MKIRGMRWWAFAIRCMTFPVFFALVIMAVVFAYLAVKCGKLHEAIHEVLPQ